jgi:hypothetical protein
MTPEELARSVAALQEDLSKIFKYFEHFDAGVRRAAYAAALSDIYRFLEHISPPRDPVPLHFHELSIILFDLKDGIAHPILQREFIKRRPGDPADVWGVRVRVACGLECLLRSGMKQKAAAKLIEKEFPGLSRLQRRDQRSSIGSVVVNWRNGLRRRKVAQPTAVTVFDNLIAEVEQFRLDAHGYKTYAMSTLERAEKAALSLVVNEESD